MPSEVILVPQVSDWQVSPPVGDPSDEQGWQLQASELVLPPYVSRGGVGLELQWQGHPPDQTETPWIKTTFDIPIELSDWVELRLWTQCDRQADGSETKPFYLGIGMNGNDTQSFDWRALPWVRLLPIAQQGKWELQRLCLTDAPQGLHSLCFFGLEHPQGEALKVLPFKVTLGDCRVTRSQLLSDVDAALAVAIQTATPALPLQMVVPESEPQAEKPYVRVTPWSVRPKGERGGSGDLVDNYTIREVEISNHSSQWVSVAYTRSPPWEVVIAYAIEVIGSDRLDVATYQSAILDYFSRHPYLIVNGDPLGLRPFHPSPEEIANLSTAGRTPLFYELSALIERSDRQPQDLAYPRLIVGDISQTAADLPVQLFATPAPR